MRSRAIAKDRHNKSEISKTGGGAPVIETLTDLEHKIISIIKVSEPLENIMDSSYQVSDTVLDTFDGIPVGHAKAPKLLDVEPEKSEFTNVSIHAQKNTQN